MSQFVEECRQEWRRLGVPDPIANEMAADLTADLEEAEAEGGSPEDVLGNSAFDPRRFAASWAAARGVTAAPSLEGPSRRRPPLLVAIAALMAVLTIGAGGALLVGHRTASVAFAARRIAVGQGPIRLFVPGPPGRIQFSGPFIGPGIGGVDVHPLAWILLLAGAVGLGLVVLYWSPWSGRRRYREGDKPKTASWN